MAEKRRGLGRGLGALIPSGPGGTDRPVDVFFPGASAPAASSPPTDRPAASQETGAETVAVIPHQSTDSGIDAPERPRGALLRSGTGVDERGAPVDAVATGTSTQAATEDATPTDRDAAGRQPGPAGAVTSDAGAVGPDAGAQPAPDTARPSSDGQDLLPVPGAHFAEIPVADIRPNPRQPRTVFDEEALAELVSSIREIGVLQPVVVRPVTDADGARYELIMGERRWRATQQAGLATIPAIVRETEDHDLLRDALLENLHRSQLNALEEAAAYQQLLDDFGCTHEELATRIHRSRPQISNTLRLLRLPPLVQRRVAAGVLSAGHARALLGLPDAAAMERLAQRIVAEGLSVRATEEIVTLGGDPERPAPVRRPRAGGRNAALDDLATRLSDRFDTRVKIALGKNKGRLTVEFASVDDLNRILATLSPEDPGLLR
ncbi:MAG: ParB/RepB/Spo0J family partition protein [Actinotalea sp.]|nr:ParB/RepB/Spo0J family partition protein [Actinotalea sp.]